MIVKVGTLRAAVILQHAVRASGMYGSDLRICCVDIRRSAGLICFPRKCTGRAPPAIPVFLAVLRVRVSQEEPDDPPADTYSLHFNSADMHVCVSAKPELSSKPV